MEQIVEKVYEDISLILPIIDIGESKLLPNNFPDNINYEIILKYLKEIGDAGEDFIFRKEINRLKMEGSKYAKDVTKSPSLNHENGYDILSFTKDGNRIYIEVKTTTGDLSEPFYMSANEYQFSKNIINSGELYQLHRVYNFGKNVHGIKVKVFTNIEDASIFKEDVLYKMSST